MPSSFITATTMVAGAVLTVATWHQWLDAPTGDVPWADPQQHAVIGLIPSFSQLIFFSNYIFH